MDHLGVVIQKDEFARLAGLEIVETSPGRAKVKMTVGPQHLNGMGVVHGGAIFTLADYAFAAACNSHGFAAVAVNASISFLKAVRSGVLTADAAEPADPGKLGTCIIRITDESGELVALFHGLSYSKKPPAGPSPSPTGRGSG
jgi:acyl-CoA thioesterase